MTPASRGFPLPGARPGAARRRRPGRSARSGGGFTPGPGLALLSRAAARVTTMPVTIRSRLLLLVLSVLLPGLLGVAWLVAHAYDAEREAHERTLRETARALASVVEAEFARRMTIARVLAGARWLDNLPELSAAEAEGLEQFARRALVGVEGWSEVRSADRLLLDTRHRPGTPAAEPPPGSAPARAGLAEFAEVRPLLGGPGIDVPHAEIVYPVRRNGRVVGQLTVTLLASELQRIVDSQALPPGGVSVVVDSAGAVVARNPGGAQHLGRRIEALTTAQTTGASEGFFQGETIEGSHNVSYFSMIANGWTFLTGMPREQVAGMVQRAVLDVALAAGLIVLAAVAAALWLARRIERPVRELEAAALQLRAGLRVPRRSTGIDEFDGVAATLSEASEALQANRHELEGRVAEAVERTRLAEQRLSSSQRIEALGRLTGGVAHDVNNLLGVISNSAHLISRHAAAGELKSPLAATHRAVEMGSQLTQHLLRFAGRRPVRPQRLEPAQALPEMRELVQSMIGRRCDLTVRVAPGTACVRADPGELELALINLALNSRDAMPRGGEVRIGARNADAADLADAPEAAVGPEPMDHTRPWVLITVSDDGIGIEPEAAAHAFEPFFTTKGLGRGTGLGLSQVHGFCVQAGGTAWLASTPGLGTTVSMLLPALEPGPAATAPVPAEAGTVDDTRAGATIQGLSVLLVEDNDALAEVTAALLRSHGASVVRTANAGDAVGVLATGSHFDVVLSDVRMPGVMDGLALAERLERERPELGVVLISGYNTAVPGPRRVLRKPCDEPELIAALAEAAGGGTPGGERRSR